MLCIMVGTRATCVALPIMTDRMSIMHGENSVESACKCEVDLVPGMRRCTFNNLVGVATKAYGAGREGLFASAIAKTPFI